MTWNVENLFRPGAGFGVTDPQLYEEKIGNLAATIAQNAPDVVALQEVGDPAALDDLLAELPGMATKRLVSTQFADHHHAIRVAALVRDGVDTADEDELYPFPAGALTTAPASDEADDVITTMGRGALGFTATVDGETVRVIVVHLKSKLLSYPHGRHQPKDEDERARAGSYALFRRAAEASAVRVWADAWLEEHGQPLVVMGDLNDGPEAATTQLLTGPPDQSLSHPDKGDAFRLVNLERFLPPDHRVSRVYHKQGELIDHIHATVDLARKQVHAELDDAHIEPIGDQPTQRRKAVWPDHAPLIATIA